MSTAAFVLVLAVLILGGVIATVGDRLGTKVGKARLSLFNLRPRQTAVLVTILSGITVSASTLAVLFATSDQLRTGVFELDKIQKRLRDARQDLDEVRQQKTQVEQQLTKARSEQTTAQQRLNTTNQSLKNCLNQTFPGSHQTGTHRSRAQYHSEKTWDRLLTTINKPKRS
ncbi:DUF3084 domain-containing protein [Neosynechococcus sphagnicola]|uniref:DUF3084 domain-containing protein n=1 Tax=Neosynechococcus sphagnicola TaxID=1501145 RepID=UPI00068E7A34|nr:DUF3084 domain-containing protein [Neosynechococcus sphagnicola]